MHRRATALGMPRITASHGGLAKVESRAACRQPHRPHRARSVGRPRADRYTGRFTSPDLSGQEKNPYLWLPVAILVISTAAATGTASVNRLPVQNGGEDFLCLFIEPYCDVFWLKPGDEFTVVPADEVSDPQFTVVAVKHRLVVWIFEGGDPAKVIVDTRSSIARELSCRRATSGQLAGAHIDARVPGLCLPDNPDKSRPDVQEPWTSARGCPGLPTLGGSCAQRPGTAPVAYPPTSCSGPGELRAVRESVQLHTGMMSRSAASARVTHCAMPS